MFIENNDLAHSVADTQEALTKLPKPAVKLYDYFIDDSASISEVNNGNGVIDAGETVRLHISLHNRGGVASNVNVSIDTKRDLDLEDPYFTFVNDTITLSDIGTYSVRESGDKYFEIIVDEKCPNDYLVNFNIRYTYENGMDEKDDTVYTDDGRQKAQFNVSRGFHLPGVIRENTVYKADQLYIVSDNVVIAQGVTVTFEEGCQIQFYDDRPYYNSPEFIVYGTLKLEGAADNKIQIAPNERNYNFGCVFRVKENGALQIDYADTLNLYVIEDYETATSVIRNSSLKVNDREYFYINFYKNGDVDGFTDSFAVDRIEDSEMELMKWNSFYHIAQIEGCSIRMSTNNAFGLRVAHTFTNNILITEALANTHADVRSLDFYEGCVVSNNIIKAANDEDPLSLILLSMSKAEEISSNTFSAGYRRFAGQVIQGYIDANGDPTVDIYGSCSNIGILWPHVVSVEMLNAKGEPITTVGKEEITVRVTFNRPMAQREDTYLTFGTIEPYADYRIDGRWVDELVWEGTYTLKAQIENGQNYLKVMNACAQEDETKMVFGELQLHEFTIDTTAAMSMNLQAIAKNEGIELTFAQDDYDTLLGYNIYSSEEKDGNFVKLNTSVVLPGETTFLDDNAEPGKTYWYTYTVVLSDFTESNPAGKVFCTAIDTLEPTIYHTPVNQGYENNNLIISCTASDNMRITAVTLYYRTAGAESWKSVSMSKVNDKYSATVFGNELTQAGLEYYIVATDGVNTVSKGTAEVPYAVVIKDASAISRLGDVDGSGMVTTKDALMLMQCLNGDLILADDAFKRADLNGDGVLSAAEALRILQYINGNVTTLEM
jgi:hypothetical protein